MSEPLTSHPGALLKSAKLNQTIAGAPIVLTRMDFYEAWTIVYGQYEHSADVTLGSFSVDGVAARGVVIVRGLNGNTDFSLTSAVPFAPESSIVTVSLEGLTVEAKIV
jgi:hypothetical protein